MAKTIAVIGTLDTRGEEIKYVKELIERKGHKAVVIDVGSLREPPWRPDISHEEVAKAAGATMKEVIALDEGKAVQVMAKGASIIGKEEYSAGRLDGVIALGASMGAWLGLEVMRALPMEVPKLMVTSEAFTGYVTSEMVSGGQTLTDCVAGLWGLNTISRVMLERAVGSITGMVEASRRIAPEKPLIGITSMGVAAFDYLSSIRPLLEGRGYEVVVFDANGAGSRDLERLIDEGLIAVALDLCLYELIQYLCSGPWGADPNKLQAAGRKGIPQIVAPGGIDFFSWAGSVETVPPRLRTRPLHAHNPKVTVVMTSTQEKARLGRVVAQKLNRAAGPTAVVIPLRGFSEFAKPGRPFHNPEGDKAFIEGLKRHLKPRVRVLEVDAFISDLQFAEAVIGVLDDMMRTKGGQV